MMKRSLPIVPTSSRVFVSSRLEGAELRLDRQEQQQAGGDEHHRQVAVEDGVEAELGHGNQGTRDRGQGQGTGDRRQEPGVRSPLV